MASDNAPETNFFPCGSVRISFGSSLPFAIPMRNDFAYAQTQASGNPNPKIKLLTGEEL
jgi:hypothetical protein